MSKIIEIRTAHNIAISFPFADLTLRVLASFIDLCIIISYWTIVSLALHSSNIWWLFALPVFFYHLIFEVFNKGQSLGKMILKIRVINMDGRSPSTYQYIMRWMFRLIDVAISFTTLGILFIISTEKKQRIGDILAQTLVVSVSKKLMVNLQTLENLESDRSNIQYPKIVHFSEKDMLLVKKTISRYQRNPNPSNRELIENISNKISNHLNIKVKRNENLAFLKQILHEYILLTR